MRTRSNRPQQHPPVDPIGSDDLVRWRRERLQAAGFDGELATTIATACGFDLHAVIELVERGCPPHLAARIQAPLDHEVEPC